MNPPPFVFHPEVHTEVDDAYEWYERQSPRLGAKFLPAVEEAAAHIQELPDVGPIIHRNVRRAFLRRFPYGVCYRVIPDRLEILAIQHTRRNPDVW